MRKEEHIEATALKTNLEAADEIAASSGSAIWAVLLS